MMNRRRVLSIGMILLPALALFTASCSHMSTDDDDSVIPCVNNPSITGSSGSSWVPSVGF